jgi:hypothetical protein
MKPATAIIFNKSAAAFGNGIAPLSAVALTGEEILDEKIARKLA